MSTQFKSVFPFVRQIFATTITLVTTAFFTAGDAAAISITSTVNSDPNTVPVFGTALQNGDFLIEDNFASWPLGDGEEERTSWNFDFNGDPNVDIFKNLIDSGSPLLSATVSLTIIPIDSFFSNDTTGIIADTDIINTRWPSFFIADLPDTDLPMVGETGIIELDLFAPRPYAPQYLFTPEKVISVFNSGTPNSIGWFWQDDALISSATLEFVVDSSFLDIPEDVPENIPEPSSLFGLGVLGIGLLFKRKQGV